MGTAADERKSDDGVAVAVMLSAALVRKLRRIKTHRDLSSLSEVVERYGGDAIDAEDRTCVEEMTAELGGEG